MAKFSATSLTVGDCLRAAGVNEIDPKATADVLDAGHWQDRIPKRVLQAICAVPRAQVPATLDLELHDSTYAMVKDIAELEASLRNARLVLARRVNDIRRAELWRNKRLGLAADAAYEKEQARLREQEKTEANERRLAGLEKARATRAEKSLAEKLTEWDRIQGMLWEVYVEGDYLSQDEYKELRLKLITVSSPEGKAIIEAATLARKARRAAAKAARV